VRAEVRSGLDRTGQLEPGHGYAELSAGARGVGRGLAAYARGELGARVDERLSVFGFAEALLPSTLTPEWQAGIGARLTW